MGETLNRIKIVGPVLLLAVCLGFLVVTHVRVLDTLTKIQSHKDTLYMTKIVYIDTGNLFNEAIAHLKEYEGFRSEIYYDTDGSKTIGYGHHLRTGEVFNKITELEATNILIKDLKRKVEFVEGHTQLKGNKSLALGLFAFNVGTGNLMQAIDRGLLNNINKITDYCHYSIMEDGEKVTKRSDKLYERRKFELYIYTR